MCREIYIIEKQAFEISNPFGVVEHWSIEGNIENTGEVFQSEFEPTDIYLSNISKSIFILYTLLVFLIFVTIVSTFMIKDTDTILDNLLYICIYSSLHKFVSISYKNDDTYNDMYHFYRTCLITGILTIQYHPVLYLLCILIHLTTILIHQIDSYTKSVVPELFISIYNIFMGYNISIMLWIIFIIAYIMTP